MSSLRIFNGVFGFIKYSNCIRGSNFRGVLHNLKPSNFNACLCSNNFVESNDLPSTKVDRSWRDLPSKNSNHIRRALIQLNSSVRKSNRIYKADIEKILLDIKKEGLSEVNHGILLLQCCGDLLPDESPTDKIDLAHKIWHNLQQLGVRLSVEHYNALLSCYIENGHTISAKKFIANMHGAEPNEATFHLLLACVCEIGDIAQATEIISLMKEKGFPASEPVFTALVLGHARAGDMKSSLGILDLMNMTQVTPSPSTYTALLQGFAETGDKVNMKKIYKEVTLKNIQLNEKQIMKIVKSLVTSGHHDIVDNVLNWLPAHETRDSTALSQTAIHLFHLGYENAAYTILDAIPTPDFESSPMYGMFLIQELIKTNKPVTNILQLTDKLVSDGKNLLALEKAAGTALSAGKTEIALALFKVMLDRGIPLRTHYFWPLFIAASISDGEQGVVEILRKMLELGVSPDFDTLVDYVLPHIALADTRIAVRKLQDCGLQVSTVLSPMMAQLLKTGQIRAAIKLCDMFKGPIQSDRLVVPLTMTYVNTREISSIVDMLKLMTSGRSTQVSDWVGQFIITVLMFRKVRSEPIQVYELAKAIHGAKLQISSFVADSLIGYLHNKLEPEKINEIRSLTDDMVNAELTVASTEFISSHIPHPREMNEEELECHRVELKSKDLNQRGVLRRLFQEHCRNGNVEKALEVKNEFETAGYEFSGGMLALLFDLMVRSGKLDEAELYFSQLKELAPKFVLDEHKIIDFAILMVSNNHFEGAIAILEERAKEHIVMGGRGVARNCWRLLNTVAENEGPEQTKSMLKKLTELGFCSVSNVILGPVIRAYIIKNDLEGAVKEFEQYSKNYKVTPLQHELLCDLTMKADVSRSHGNSGSQISSQKATDLMQQVLNICNKVHGHSSTNVNLAVVLAENGMVKQLRRFLMGSQGIMVKNYLLNRLKRLVDEDKLETLQNFVAASKDLTTVNVQPIYTMMLEVHSRRGDCDGALSLWTSIQESEEQPTPEFLELLAELLHSHKREVPFVVPSEKVLSTDTLVKSETLKGFKQKSSFNQVHRR